MRKPERKGTKVPVMTAKEAVTYIKDNDSVAICGAGGGIVDPEVLIHALSERYEETGEPKDLTLWHATGLGDRNDRGMSPLAKKGLVKRVIGGHWGQSPRLAEMAERNEIEAYNFPQGRVTDHRIKLTLHKLDSILNGDLDEVIDSLIAADQTAKLAKMEE